MKIKNNIKKQLEKNGTVNMKFNDVVVDSIFKMTMVEFENIKMRKENEHLDIVGKFEKAVRKTNSLKKVEKLENLFEGKVASENADELQNAERFFDAFDSFESFAEVLKREEVEQRFELFQKEMTEEK